VSLQITKELSHQGANGSRAKNTATQRGGEGPEKKVLVIFPQKAWGGIFETRRREKEKREENEGRIHGP